MEALWRSGRDGLGIIPMRFPGRGEVRIRAAGRVYVGPPRVAYDKTSLGFGSSVPIGIIVRKVRRRRSYSEGRDCARRPWNLRAIQGGFEGGCPRLRDSGCLEGGGFVLNSGIRFALLYRSAEPRVFGRWAVGKGRGGYGALALALSNTKRVGGTFAAPRSPRPGVACRRLSRLSCTMVKVSRPGTGSRGISSRREDLLLVDL
jgi:hypothetical protein